MLINTEQMISMSEANQNFSRVARMVDQEGQAIILKNNVPRYLVIEFSQAEQEQTASDEDVREISRRLIARNHAAYEENLLESALAAPFQTFNDQPLYPSLQQKAVRLCYGIVMNHPFLDGNKRIGAHVMLK